MQLMKILHGLPACGKSTYRDELLTRESNYSYINWDEARHSDPNWVYTKEAEHAIQQQSFDSARQLIRAGRNLLIDNTNLNKNTLMKWQLLAESEGIVWIVKRFDTPLDECIRRNALRTGWQHVPRPVIERMALFNGLVDFPTDKKLVLVDMDGTLADCEHRRHFLEVHPCPSCIGAGMALRSQSIGDKMTHFHSPVAKCTACKGSGSTKKNWDGFYSYCISDPPVEPILKWVTALGDDPEFIVCIVSGRPTDKAGTQTVQWLEKHNVPYDRIFMRAAADHRPDYMVKQEILDRLPKNQIAFVIDDRPQVIRMWRENGIKTIDVGEGIEF